MKHKLINAIPFLIIVLIMLYTWFEIITTEYLATWQHYLTMILLIINGVLYFVRFRAAVLFTGIVLLLASFNLLTFYTITKTTSIGFNTGGSTIATPGIQWWSLLILIVYVFINFNLLADWYLDLKESRNQKK